MGTQLVLPFEAKNLLGFEHFYAEQNSFTLTSLKFWPPQDQYLFLQGPSGSGKTHVAEALAKSRLIKGEKVVFLTGEQLKNQENLSELDFADLIIVDDFDTLFPAQAKIEKMLFYFYNHLMTQSTKLLLVSEKKLGKLKIHLKDLESRLKTGLQLYLTPVSGEGLIEVLKLHETRLSMQLSEDVRHYLLHHLPRTSIALIQGLEKLAEVSLRDQRKLTLSYVRQILF